MFFVHSLIDVPNAAEKIVNKIQDHTIIAFCGAMGTGKTTLIKSIVQKLGGQYEEVKSPTFSIVNEYATKTGSIIYHFDFYRINDEKEVYDLGYEDYFYSGNLCLIEWPEKIDRLIPLKTLEVHIFQDGNKRIIEIR